MKKEKSRDGVRIRLGRKSGLGLSVFGASRQSRIRTREEKEAEKKSEEGVRVQGWSSESSRGKRKWFWSWVPAGTQVRIGLGFA